MKTFLTLTLDRARDGQYRVGINPTAFAYESHFSRPSMFEAESLDEAMSDLENRLIAIFHDYHERKFPVTEVDADLGLLFNRRFG
jgi:hypothetical protein